MIVENGKRKLLRARAFIGPLEAPFGELLDVVVLAERTAVDRDLETVDLAPALVSLHGNAPRQMIYARPASDAVK